MALLRIKDRLRKWLEVEQVKEPSEDVPVGIDKFANLPVHYEPPECPICKFEEFQCHDCKGTIIDPELPGGLGFESITVTHLHIHPQYGRVERTLRIPARRKLCLKCFRLDWEKANPGIPCDI